MKKKNLEKILKNFEEDEEIILIETSSILPWSSGTNPEIARIRKLFEEGKMCGLIKPWVKQDLSDHQKIGGGID